MCIRDRQQAMEEGKIAYAGKYSAPDYEQILAAGCRLAIENTMILHTPEDVYKRQGKEMTGGDLSVRTPACCWYGGANPRSRGIGCTKKP